MTDPLTSPNRKSRPGSAIAPWILPALCLTTCIIWLAWPHRTDESTRGPIVADDPATLRAVACADAPLAYLVAASSDEDWRVRAAAYEAMSLLDPLDDVPLRDTPIDEREAIMLRWLDHVAPALADDLCEVHARPEHLRFGRTLVARCLICHVGDEPTSDVAAERCDACHEVIHRQWAGTAHANSLSHLRLITIDPGTRQQALLDFGDRKGMSCLACHRPPATDAPQAADTHSDNGCLTTFDTPSCGECHLQAQEQWQTWITAPRYRKATWPPGSVELDDSKPAGCTGCHMPAGEHLWAARRDPDLLSRGISLSVSRNPEGQGEIILRNLAGHAYPTGTTRRALQLYASVDGHPEQLIATLAEALPGSEIASAGDIALQPPLQPGETRRFTLPNAQASVHARLGYLRNRFQPNSYHVEVTTLDGTLPPQPVMDGSAQNR